MEDRVVPRSSKRITQKYKPLFHKGVDIGWSTVEENNKIHANCKGIVYEIQDNQVNNKKSTGKKTWGNYVYVKHPNGMFTRYAHLKEGLLVKEGDQVNEETVIGIIGNTGRSYGRHLHFEVATGYSSSKRINPTEPLIISALFLDISKDAPTNSPSNTVTPVRPLPSSSKLIVENSLHADAKIFNATAKRINPAEPFTMSVSVLDIKIDTPTNSPNRAVTPVSPTPN